MRLWTRTLIVALAIGGLAAAPAHAKFTILNNAHTLAPGQKLVLGETGTSSDSDPAAALIDTTNNSVIRSGRLPVMGPASFFRATELDGLIYAIVPQTRSLVSFNPADFRLNGEFGDGTGTQALDMSAIHDIIAMNSGLVVLGEKDGKGAATPVARNGTVGPTYTYDNIAALFAGAPDGSSALAAGTTTSGDAVIIRTDANWQLIDDFGMNGRSVHNLGTSADRFFAVRPVGSSKIVAGGAAGGNGAFAILNSTDGELVTYPPTSDPNPFIATLGGPSQVTYIGGGNGSVVIGAQSFGTPVPRAHILNQDYDNNVPAGSFSGFVPIDIDGRANFLGDVLPYTSVISIMGTIQDGSNLNGAKINVSTDDGSLQGQPAEFDLTGAPLFGDPPSDSTPSDVPPPPPPPDPPPPDPAPTTTPAAGSVFSIDDAALDDFGDFGSLDRGNPLKRFRITCPDGEELVIDPAEIRDPFCAFVVLMAIFDDRATLEDAAARSAARRTRVIAKGRFRVREGRERRVRLRRTKAGRRAIRRAGGRRVRGRLRVRVRYVTPGQATQRRTFRRGVRVRLPQP